VCELDAHEVCTGCGRTRGEIAIWPYADSNLRREIRRLAQLRKQQAPPPAQPPALR
jgi:predicted Fe-S protein YdhL (DUF1289 family)